MQVKNIWRRKYNAAGGGCGCKKPLETPTAIAGEIRLASKRGLLGDKGNRCFQNGANAAISADMLTTAGITASSDKKMLQELAFSINK